MAPLNKAKYVLNLLCAFLFVLLYLPIIFLIGGAFYNSKIGQWTWEWVQLFYLDTELLHALLRSFNVAIVSATISCVISLGIAWSLLAKRFFHQKLLRFFVQQALVLPELTFALALLAWFSFLKIPLGFWTIVIAHVTFTVSFVVLILEVQFSKIDNSHIEAAMDLGASQWEVFCKIIGPQVFPAILSGFLLAFLLSFDDFIVSFFVAGAGYDTLPIKLYARSKMGFTPAIHVISALLFAMSALICFLLFKLGKVQSYLKK